MAEYAAPLADMHFTLDVIAGLPSIAALPGFDNAAPDVVDAVLEEAGKFAGGVLSPLNVVGDKQGSRLENGVVRTPDGFKDAYRRYVDAGWNALPFAPEHGGQGLPHALAISVMEMWISANMAFTLCPLLTVGAVDAIETHGTEEQKRLYLDKLVSGEWSGTMNLTEPQAGSDVGALRSRAVREGDHYRITGQKIFITYGEHDMAPNIVHLVLARLPDSPAGTRGLSLFLVPKFLVNADGSLGERNDVRCVSLEHKLGIHASPTCVLAYGDNGGAIGWLVGEENRGMECMFTMMNNARLQVGLQGLAIGERAYQQARDFARQRIQGRPITATGPDPLPIVHHPDVRRMLLSMRARIEAMRALIYCTAAHIDRARHEPDEAVREHHQRRVDLLIPVVKAWCTDQGVEIASTGIQIHGGMGFIEETGAAQHLRDARIAPIYEGTNGIQANDLVGRKLWRDQGAAAYALIEEMRAFLTLLGAAPLSANKNEQLVALHLPLAAGIEALDHASQWLLDHASDQARAITGAVPYLELMGIVVGGWLMAKSALEAETRLLAGEGDAEFNKAKLLTARFYAEQILPRAPTLFGAIKGGDTVLAFNLEQL